MTDNGIRVLGIDPGTQATGWAVIEERGNALSSVDYGAVRLARSLSFEEKLVKIYAELSAVLSRLKPDEAALENVFYGRSARSSLVIGQARGVAVLAVAHAGVPLAHYEPALVKKAVVGAGRAQKEQMQEMVRVLLRLPEVPKPHDAADALAIAICHCHRRAW